MSGCQLNLTTLLQRSQSKYTVLGMMGARTTWCRVHWDVSAGDGPGARWWRWGKAGATFGTWLVLEQLVCPLHQAMVMGSEQCQESYSSLLRDAKRATTGGSNNWCVSMSDLFCLKLDFSLYILSNLGIIRFGLDIRPWSFILGQFL